MILWEQWNSVLALGIDLAPLYGARLDISKSSQLQTNKHEIPLQLSHLCVRLPSPIQTIVVVQHTCKTNKK